LSSPLELKIRIRELEARVLEQEKLLKKLSDSLSTAVPYRPEVNFGVDFGVEPAIVAVPQATTPTLGQKTYKLCPKCGVKPAYFFHVRSCGKQKEEKTHGDDGNRSTGGS
jgi:hypothetical protein